MSRFVAILNNHEYEITVKSFRDMLSEMTMLLEADAGPHRDERFPYFVRKASPVTGVTSLMDYEVTLIGRIASGSTSNRGPRGGTGHEPVSLLEADFGLRSPQPAIARHGEGRDSRGWLWIEELIDVVESEASCELFGLLKRPDEKFVTERAYENPKFVEDMVRDVARRLNDEERIVGYVVEAENFESIHNHSAYAFIERDKEREAARGLNLGRLRCRALTRRCRGDFPAP